ncbi:MAG TPA: peptidoglycan bridge formation glycyltransferase FemA/FemB family protein [Candidatus Andersenbacteria bacterium]|nr:MAG: hypothetical protein A2854_01805 [Parcubacteria group bacterium RIFCSPHIGHO2_01_FULL_56_18]HLD25685.1 peptidoglycan bridge formation glycyltransferase FemA/FemB family protein [Candidatus Andersenbacteria bacterium]
MIKEITDPATWNSFLEKIQPNTFLQSWQWGQVQKATGENARCLGVFEGNQQVGAALVIVVNARRGRHYLIPHGPIFSPTVEEISRGQTVLPLLEGELEGVGANSSTVRELITYLKSAAKQDRVVALRVAPLLKNTLANHQLFRNLGFRPAPLHVHAELTWLLDINKSDEELLAGMRKTTRHAIRKAEQGGVTAEVITDPALALARFWPLYQETHTRHGFVLWPQEMIRSQLEIFSAHNNIFTVIARHNNQDVAAAIIPIFSTTAFYYHGASEKLPSNIPAAQLVQWAAIREARHRGLTRYNFWGIAPNNQPQHPFTGITTFKKGFGGYAIDYLHAQDLPLSFKYWQLWAVDSWRKYRRGF